jgi:hypothetical protein
VLKFGGEKALTKHVHDALTVDDMKIEVVPQIIDNTMVIGTPHIARKPKGKVKVRMVKAKATTKRSRLDRATSHLYDLEDSNGPEKPLNIDFGLYQIENY